MTTWLQCKRGNKLLDVEMFQPLCLTQTYFPISICCPALRVNDYVTMKQTPNYRTFNDLNSHKQPTMYQDS